ncbi:gamma-glutamyl hydrolase-like isoform X2 [Lasioglossum baleicum]
MKAIGSTIIFLLGFAFSGMDTASVRFKDTNGNKFPIIGILSQEVSEYMQSHYKESHSYIAASYVKFIEGAGARVVPIWIGKPRSYYETIMAKINGILLPGGNSLFDAHDGYADAACTIYDIAKQMNDTGNYFPIFGICLGFEVLVYAMADRSDTARRECSDSDRAISLAFEPGYDTSKLFRSASETIIDGLQFKNLTYNAHIKCVTKQILKDHGIADQLRVLSTSIDEEGLKYISAFESISYPFYGLQFHPEKNLYEWKRTKHIPHGIYASRISQYFANFFVGEARKNYNEFSDKNEEARSLIYNYNPTYTALHNSAFVQCYLFKDDHSGL